MANQKEEVDNFIESLKFNEKLIELKTLISVANSGSVYSDVVWSSLLIARRVEERIINLKNELISSGLYQEEVAKVISAHRTWSKDPWN